MKKLWLLLLAGCAMTLTPACTNEDDDKGPAAPVECSVPATAEIGGTMTISGQGFAATAEVALRDAAGVETPLEDPEITASGFTGTVPATLKEGSYTVVLHQDGTWEIGQVTLTVAPVKENPVLNVVVPSAIRLNETLEIAGLGFTQEMGIVLRNTADQERTELTVALSSNGVECTIPSGTAAGSYDVILTQGNDEWTLAEAVPAAVYKRLKSVSVTSAIECEEVTVEELAQFLIEDSKNQGMPMDEATAQAYAEMYISYGAFDPTVTTASYSFTYDASGNPAGSKMKGMYDEAESDWFSFTVDGDRISATNQKFEEGTDGMRSFAWTLNNGRVDQSAVSYEKRDVNYVWAYDAQGLWSGVNFAVDNSAYMTLAYDAGKFTGSEGNSMFTYDAAPQQNAIFGIDIAKLIFGLQTINIIEADHLAAILLNLAGTPSTALPATITEMDGSTPGITYQFDEEGYVTKIDWEVANGKDPNFQHFDASSKTSYTLIYE